MSGHRLCCYHLSWFARSSEHRACSAEHDDVYVCRPSYMYKGLPWMWMMCPIVRGYEAMRVDKCAMLCVRLRCGRGDYVLTYLHGLHPHAYAPTHVHAHPCARAHRRPPSISAEPGQILPSTSKRTNDLGLREVPSDVQGSCPRSVSRRAEGPPYQQSCTERTTFALHLPSALLTRASLDSLGNLPDIKDILDRVLLLRGLINRAPQGP